MVTALNRKLLRDLRLSWSQALTIALVVASGVGGYISSLSAVDSLALSRDRYYAEGRFADVFTTLKRAPRSIEDRVRELPGVADAQATLEQSVRLTLPGIADPIVGHLIGQDIKRPSRMNLVSIRDGRMPQGLTESAGGGALEAVVSVAFAQAREVKLQDRISALINGKRRELIVVGAALSPEYVFAGRQGMPDMRGFAVLWVDHDALAAAYDMAGAINQIALRVAPGASDQKLVDQLNRTLEPYGGVSAVTREDQSSHRMLQNELKEQRVLGTVLPAIFLAVAAFLLNVVLSRQIATQREQIATLKAVGYTNVQIAAHYLKFIGAIVIAGVAGGVVIGNVLGRYYMQIYGAFFTFPVQVYTLGVQLVAIGAVVSIATAIVGALHAITATLKLAPAEAMRPPAPGRYRLSMVERAGLAGILTPSMQMIVRNMERRPLRSLLVIGGIAASLAIVVMGNFSRDAMDYIVTTLFTRAYRADVTVAMLEPVQASVQHQLAREPGVLAVEAGRDVPVRFVNGHHTYRGAIQGFAETQQLRRVIDSTGTLVDIPADGILLSDRLAQKLGLQIGDQVLVEILTGSRERHMLTLTATVDDMMGLNAYMRRGAINRVLREDDLASQFELLVERGRETELLARLNDLPRAGSTFSKATTLRNLEEVSARNVRIMSTIMTGFALVIAVGIVYNSARVVFAERAWELASLRVLGFTRGEVSALLLGELAIEVLIALPLGMIMGYGLVRLIIELLKSDQFSFPLVISASTYVFAAVAVVLAGAISALVVRRRINRLDMVSVLKTRE
jgi:putative ABC transport system permease protein